MTWVILFALLWLAIRMFISLGTRADVIYRHRPAYRHHHATLYRMDNHRNGR